MKPTIRSGYKDRPGSSPLGFATLVLLLTAGAARSQNAPSRPVPANPMLSLRNDAYPLSFKQRQ